MEKIKLIIKQLGRIRNSEIEITPWMIFSGESGMGKSYLATLVHYFFEVLLNTTYIDEFFKSQNIIYNDLLPNFHSKGNAFTIDKSILENWLAKDAIRYISYMINDKNIKAEISVQLPKAISEKIECDFEEEMIGMENDVETYVKYSLPGLTYRIKNTPIGINEESQFAYFFRFYLIKTIFGNYQAIDNAFVLPPSRGAAMTAAVTPSSGMFLEFLKGKRLLESARINSSTTSPELVDLMNDVMEGKVSLSENNQYRYRMSLASDNDDMPLTAAASSIRELAIVQMMIDNVDISKTVLFFEEPEAHLHPEKQRMMADVISCMSKAGTYMQITTHSDYLLRRLNELIQLKRIENTSEEKFHKLQKDIEVPIDILPNIDSLSAVLLERQPDGSSKIVKQEIENGIPYTSFYNALKKSIDNTSIINQPEEE